MACARRLHLLRPKSAQKQFLAALSVMRWDGLPRELPMELPASGPSVKSCLARPRTNDYSVVTDRSRPRSPNIFPGKADDTTSCTFNWKPRPKENNAEPVRHLARLWPPPLPVQNQWSGFLSMWPNSDVTQTQ